MHLAFTTYYTRILALRNTISKSGKQIEKITDSKNIKRGLKYKSHHHLSVSEAIVASIQTITEKDTWIGHAVRDQGVQRRTGNLQHSIRLTYVVIMLLSDSDGYTTWRFLSEVTGFSFGWLVCLCSQVATRWITSCLWRVCIPVLWTLLTCQRSAHGHLCREISCLWTDSMSCLTMPGRSLIVYQPVTPMHAATQYLSPGSLCLLLFSVGAMWGHW